MHLAGISGHPRRISDYPTIFYRVHYIESIGTLGGVLSLIIFGFAIIIDWWNSIGVIGILLFWKHKSSNIILNDMNVEIIYNPVFYCIFILYIIGIAGFPLFILFFNKFYITCMLAQDNGLSIVMEFIIITLLAAN